MKTLLAIAIVFLLVSFGYATNCTFSISPTGNTFPSGGGIGGVDITAQNGCTWNAKSNASWISVSPPSGTGNGSIQYSVGVNSSRANRTGTINIAGKQFKVTESGDPNPPIVFTLHPLPQACLYSPYNYAIPPASGGLGNFHYQLDSGGFPPMGIILEPNGILSGVPTAPGRKSFRICAVDIGGYSKCVSASITVSNTPCCSAPSDVCDTINNYGMCSEVTTCITHTGYGYYKVGETYYCCEGKQTEMDCEQANNNLEQDCSALSPLCTSFVYSDWSECQPNGTQTRYIISEQPPDCDPANADLERPCKYIPPKLKGGTYSGTCTATGTPICCPPPGGCTPGISITESFAFPIPAGASGSVVKSKLCPILTQALKASGCMNVSCNVTSLSSDSFGISLSCTIPGNGCSNETVSETCSFTLD